MKRFCKVCGRVEVHLSGFLCCVKCIEEHKARELEITRNGGCHWDCKCEKCI